MPIRVKRTLLFGCLAPIAFVGSCVALMPPAFRLADPMTHLRLESQSVAPFPILIVQGDGARVLMLEDLRSIPPLPAGATYLVPPGKEASIQRDLHAQAPPGRDSSWILNVERIAPDRQRIELYLMGDGYWGGAYDATHGSVTPLYRKITGPGFAFVAGILALSMNVGLWGVAAAAYKMFRRRQAAGSASTTRTTPDDRRNK